MERNRGEAGKTPHQAKIIIVLDAVILLTHGSDKEMVFLSLVFSVIVPLFYG